MADLPPFVRTVIGGRNVTWGNAEHTRVNCEVAFEELQATDPWVPYAARQSGADVPWEEEIWARASSGEWGPIGDYVPVTPPIPLSAKQIRLALLNRGFDLAAFEAGLGAQHQIIWRYANEFYRGEPFLTQLGLSDADINALWEEGLKL